MRRLPAPKLLPKHISKVNSNHIGRTSKAGACEIFQLGFILHNDGAFPSMLDTFPLHWRGCSFVIQASGTIWKEQPLYSSPATSAPGKLHFPNDTPLEWKRLQMRRTSTSCNPYSHHKMLPNRTHGSFNDKYSNGFNKYRGYKLNRWLVGVASR